MEPAPELDDLRVGLAELEDDLLGLELAQFRAAINFAYGHKTGPSLKAYAWPDPDPALIARTIAETPAGFDAGTDTGLGAAQVQKFGLRPKAAELKPPPDDAKLTPTQRVLAARGVSSLAELAQLPRS